MAKKRGPAAAQPGERYTVLARRYRPQQFAEVIGQDHVAQALTNAIQAHRVAHAYLFTGARGVGKTSMARILSKALNCTHGPTATPCGVCDICQSIARGDDVHVLEIDGASNRGIDEVRELRQNVNYRPSRARFKIYYIDEVHMLTKEAFNALLKTLEEPPEHVKFIFATTEAPKIPVTILSRCQRFDFAAISPEAIAGRLRQVVQAEGVAADEDALDAIARRAAGSMRDSQSLLDQLLAFSGDRLTAGQVHALLGTASDDQVIALAERLIAHDPAGALKVLDAALHQGVQPGELLDQWLEYFRDLMVLAAAGPEVRLVSVSSRQRPVLVRQATAWSLETILAALQVLAETRARLRGSTYARTLMEMAVVRICRLEDLVSIADLSERLAAIEAGPAGAGPAARTAPPGPGVKKKPAVAKPRPANSPDPGGTAAAKPPAPATGPRPALTPDTAAEVWRAVIDRAGGPLLKHQLSAAVPSAISAPPTLVISFPAQYNHWKTEWERPERLQKVQAAAQEVVGGPCQVRFEVHAPLAPAQPVAAELAAGRAPRSSTLADVDQDPLVKTAIDRFGARIVRVDEAESRGQGGS